MAVSAILKNKYLAAGMLWMAISISACPAVQGRSQSLLEGLDLPDSLKFCGEPVPLNDARIRERFEKEMLLALWNRPQVLLWLKRAPRYLPYIARTLNAQNMPDDLKYLAVAESALLPHAGSPKGAVGFWQLLADTARKYGLTVDQFIDERRNLFSSTPAALRYLQELHGKFSSWTLAMAAYNMGEQGLAAEILEQRIKDYYHLYLPLETQRFVFRVIAVKLILSEPERYGFKLSPDQLYKPIAFDNASIDCIQELPIQLVAEAAGSCFKEIKDLNPHLRGHYLQAGHHQIHLPAGRATDFQTRLNKLVSQYTQNQHKRLYIVQRGDNLSTIAEKFDVPLAALIIWNRIDHTCPIHPGDRLIIHPRRLDQIEP